MKDLRFSQQCCCEDTQGWRDSVVVCLVHKILKDCSAVVIIDSLTLKMEAVWLFKTSGSTHPVMQDYMPRRQIFQFVLSLCISITTEYFHPRPVLLVFSLTFKNRASSI
jgi:hypothetical protein